MRSWEQAVRLMSMLGYSWRDRELLFTALRHTTYCNEHKDLCEEPNERLEFLGDSVLDMLVAEALYMRNPLAREGWLSDKRAERVSERSLAARARRLRLGPCISFGKGGQALIDSDRVLADAMEALVGAAYLDGGLEAARTVVVNAGIV